MSKLFSYTKLIIFSLLVLSGVQIPGFVSEYGKNLEARYAESKTSIQPFQQTADKHFNGDISKLVQHYNNKNDAVINEGAAGINSLYQRFQLLSNSLTNFKTSQLNAYSQTFLSPILDIRQQTWDNYNFNVVFNKEAIGFGVIFALLLVILFEIISWLFRKLFFKKQPKRIYS